MTPTAWSVAILVAAVAGLLAFRTLSRGIRFAFDVVCLLALSLVLLQRGATPFLTSSAAAPDTATLWLRVLVVAWWLVCARAVVAVLYFQLRHDRAHPSAKLVVDLTAAAIYVGVALIVLKSVLVLPVGGLVATSGVVAIVLGLALQSTLADVFAGIAVDIEAPFQVGDRIFLGDIEGRVIETNWRSIRVQTDDDDIAVIPNSVMAKLQIVNRNVPSRRRAVSANVRCPVTVDPERVIRVLHDSILLCPDILESPASSVALTRLGRRWNHYTVAFSVAETSLMGGTKSLLLRHARKQLHHAGLLERDAGDLVLPATRSRPRSTPMMLAPREVLGELILFEGLQPAQLEDLSSHVTTHLLEPDEILFAEGAADATLYVVASGVLELTRAAGTTASSTLGRIGAGEYVGELGLLTGAPHTATATARTHCVLYELRREAIAVLLDTNADVAAALEKSVRRGLELTSRNVVATATGDVGARGQLLQRILRFFRSDAA
jgi:small-conductance mechanosensitive channel/CRP-like cAMP-binding protein